MPRVILATVATRCRPSVIVLHNLKNHLDCDGAGCRVRSTRRMIALHSFLLATIAQCWLEIAARMLRRCRFLALHSKNLCQSSLSRLATNGKPKAARKLPAPSHLRGGLGRGATDHAQLNVAG